MKIKQENLIINFPIKNWKLLTFLVLLVLQIAVKENPLKQMSIEFAGSQFSEFSNEAIVGRWISTSAEWKWKTLNPSSHYYWLEESDAQFWCTCTNEVEAELTKWKL